MITREVSCTRVAVSVLVRSAGAFASETEVNLSPLNVPRAAFVVEKEISESFKTTSLRPLFIVAVIAIVTSLSKGTVIMD